MPRRGELDSSMVPPGTAPQNRRRASHQGQVQEEAGVQAGEAGVQNQRLQACAWALQDQSHLSGLWRS